MFQDPQQETVFHFPGITIIVPEQQETSAHRES